MDRLDYRISFVNFFSPPEKDLLIIRQDYEKINDKIKAGKAHELSESDTLYLGAATKGATAQKSMVPQYYGDHTLAKKRNYCYKQKYMNYVLHEYVLKNNVPCEPIIQEDELRDTTFEELITSKISKYIGMSDKEYVNFLMFHTRTTKHNGILYLSRCWVSPETMLRNL